MKPRKIKTTYLRSMVGIFTEFSLSPSSPRSQSLPHTDSWVKTQHGFSKTFTQRRPPPQMTPCIPTLQGLTLLSLTRFTVHYLFCFCFCIFFCLSPAASPCVYTHTHTHTHTLTLTLLCCELEYRNCIVFNLTSLVPRTVTLCRWDSSRKW